MEILLIVFALYVVFVFTAGLYDFFLHQSNSREQDKKAKNEIDNWLQYEEPLHRVLHIYPPDWGMRRQYIAKLYNYTCQLCMRKGWLGFHIHHVNPLSKGGNNAFENLIYLCKYCHENQHPHMIEERKKKYWLRKKNYINRRV